MSTLDYCSILLNGLIASQINPLNQLQRLAVQIVFNLPKFTLDKYSITKLMINLGWLSIEKRIQYKTLLSLTHNAIYQSTPTYLARKLELKYDILHYMLNRSHQ